MKTITKQEMEELEELYSLGPTQEFNEKLEELTGIEVRPYTGYQYFCGGDYIGDNSTETLDEILQRAYITVGVE